MRITSLKRQVHNPQKISVFLDGKYYCSVLDGSVLDLGVKTGLELDEVSLAILDDRSSYDGHLLGAYRSLGASTKSAQQLRQYLYKRKAKKEHIEKIVDFLETKSLLNDAAAAAHLLTSLLAQKKHSVSSIKLKLRAKGYKREIIDTVVLEQLDADETSQSDEAALIALIEKVKDRSRYQDANKLTRFLLSKGFSYARIKQHTKPA
jgi:regulatory protein